MAKSQNIIEAIICLLFGVYGAHRFYGKDYGNGIIYFLSGGCLLVGFLSDFVLTIIDFDFTHLLRKDDNLKKEQSVNTYKKVSLIGKIIGLVGFWIGLIVVIFYLAARLKRFPSTVTLGIGIFFLVGLVINVLIILIRLLLFKDDEQHFELISDVSGPTIESKIKRRYIVTGIITLLLIISGVLYLILKPATVYVQDGYEELLTYGGELEKKYGHKGPYTNTVSEVFELPSEVTSAYKNLKSIKVWYPEDLLKNNTKLPLILISNGSGLKYSLYEPVFQRLATWGFVVVGTDDIHTANGASNDYALRFVLNLTNTEGNKLTNKIDVDHIGMKGFSEGSTGAINAVTNYESGKYYKAIFLTSAVANAEKRKELGFEFDISKLNIPFCSIGGTGASELNITPLEDMIINYNTVKEGIPKIMGRRKDAEHSDMLTWGDGYMTAFFMQFLKDDILALKVFRPLKDEKPEMMSNNNWSDFKAQNLPQFHYVKEGYEEKIEYGGDLERKYGHKGPYNTTSKVFKFTPEIESTYNLSLMKIWFPTDLEEKNEKFPLVLLANGANLTYENYEAVFPRLATWGFIVAGTNDIHTHKGTSIDFTLRYLLELNSKEGDPLYNKIDIDNIGIRGFSEGSTGAVNAVTKFESGQYYKAIFVTSIMSGERASAGGYDLTKLNIPYCNMAGNKGDELYVSPLEGMIENYNKIKEGLPKIMARRRGAVHNDMLSWGDGYLTAYFMYFLKGDTEALKVFKDIDGGKAEIGNNPNWSDFKADNLP